MYPSFLELIAKCIKTTEGDVGPGACKEKVKWHFSVNKQQRKEKFYMLQPFDKTDHMWQDIEGPDKALMLMSHSSLSAVKYHTAQCVTPHGAPTTQINPKDKP